MKMQKNCLEQHPDHKDIMQATLVAFETGYTQAINDMLKTSKDKDVTMKQFARAPNPASQDRLCGGSK